MAFPESVILIDLNKDISASSFLFSKYYHIVEAKLIN
jgi:hypothetical protein